MHICCMAFDCRFNTNKTPHNGLCGYCNLDVVDITNNYKCLSFIKKE